MAWSHSRKCWVEILDHGDDPGRFTVVHGDGTIYTCNENGSIICKRRCRKPGLLIQDLTREAGIRIMKYALVAGFLKKVSIHLSIQTDNDDS